MEKDPSQRLTLTQIQVRTILLPVRGAWHMRLSFQPWCSYRPHRSIRGCWRQRRSCLAAVNKKKTTRAELVHTIKISKNIFASTFALSICEKMEADEEAMEVYSGEEASFSQVLRLLVESLMSNESDNLRYNSQFLSRLRRLLAKMLDLITSKAKGEVLRCSSSAL